MVREEGRVHTQAILGYQRLLPNIQPVFAWMSEPIHFPGPASRATPMWTQPKSHLTLSWSLSVLDSSSPLVPGAFYFQRAACVTMKSDQNRRGRWEVQAEGSLGPCGWVPYSWPFALNHIRVDFQLPAPKVLFLGAFSLYQSPLLPI